MAIDTKAFPTVFGAGALTTGGRGGTVLHVTNLLWNNTAGSLKWALEENYPRIIVFDVSGIIEIPITYQDGSARSYWSAKGDVTIAGQTAPEGGITIRGEQLGFDNQNNIIIRYIKFRKPGSTSRDDWCLNIRQASNVVVDHCSFSYSEEYALGAGTTGTAYETNITFQNNLFTECKDATLIGDSDGINSPLGDYSILNNIYSNVGWRTPCKLGGTLKVDIINNLIHNWWAKPIRADRGADYELNIIGNYYQTGNSTRNNDASWNGHTMWRIETYSSMSPKIWDEDNTWTVYDQGGGNEYDPKPVGYPANKSLAWKERLNSDQTPPEPEWFMASRLPLKGVGTAEPIIIASSAVKSALMPEVGANKYLNADGSVSTYRDPIDTTAITNVDNEISYSYAANWASASSGLPTMPASSRPTGYYNPSKSLDVPEAWYDAQGYTTELATDINPVTQRMIIEDFINAVDGEEIITVISATGVSFDNNTQTIGTGETVNKDVTFTPTNTTNQAVTYVSNNPNVLSHTGEWVAEGSATLTVTSNDGSFTDIMTVTCSAASTLVTGVSITPSIAEIAVGATQQLTTTYNPINASNQTGVWSSSNNNLATVDSNGLVTALSSSPNLVANSSFDSDTVWTKQITAWTIANGVAHCDGTQTHTRSIYQDIGAEINKTYTVTVTSSGITQGGFKVYIGGDEVSVLLTTNDTHVFDLSPTFVYDSYLWIQCDLDFIGDIESITVVEKAKISYTTNDGDFTDSSIVTVTTGVGETPVITLTGSSIINLNIGDTYTELGAQAVDFEDGDLTVVITGKDTEGEDWDGSTIVPGTFYKHYNAQDSNGNNAIQITRTIIVDNVLENIVYELTERERAIAKHILLKLIKII